MPYADKERQREYARKWIAARRAEYFADKTCAYCGATDNLELDHIDPRTKVTHRVWSWKLERREAELAKCQVLCCTCHDMKSVADLPVTHGLQPAWHGTATMYNKGCRCQPCTYAKNERQNYFRAKRRERLAATPL